MFDNIRLRAMRRCIEHNCARLRSLPEGAVFDVGGHPGRKTGGAYLINGRPYTLVGAASYATRQVYSYRVRHTTVPPLSCKVGLLRVALDRGVVTISCDDKVLATGRWHAGMVVELTDGPLSGEARSFARHLSNELDRQTLPDVPTLNVEYNGVLRKWAFTGYGAKPECESCGCDLTGESVADVGTGWYCQRCGEHSEYVDEDDRSSERRQMGITY